MLVEYVGQMELQNYFGSSNYILNTKVTLESKEEIRKVKKQQL